MTSNKPTPEELKQWREAAEKATPGVWTKTGWGCISNGLPGDPEFGHIISVVDTSRYSRCGGSIEANSAHIANMNPENALRLIARVEELEKHLRAILDDHSIDHYWECATVQEGEPKLCNCGTQALADAARAALEGGGE